MGTLSNRWLLGLFAVVWNNPFIGYVPVYDIIIKESSHRRRNVTFTYVNDLDLSLHLAIRWAFNGTVKRPLWSRSLGKHSHSVNA
ncbi:hypothetical protein F5887DRAFT_1011162 [Amanita rubescens]|nr:hypothetical protein F5887DRAFT_1011162 [Amanita rubescens]